MIETRKVKISKLYHKILNRAPDGGGLAGYQQSALSIDEIESRMLDCQELGDLVKLGYSSNTPLLKVPKRFNEKEDWAPGASIAHYDSDSEALFLENRKRLKDQWRWYDEPITYQFNKLGYRMAELENIDYNNYIAFFGCSYTFGLGLPLEKTFAHMIGQRSGCDVVNAAMSGSSNRAILQNLMRVLSWEQKPKQVIINWTQMGRNSFWNHPGQIDLNFPIQKEQSAAYRAYTDRPELWGYEFLEQRQFANVMCKLASVDLLEFTMFGGVEKFSPGVKTFAIDWYSPGKSLEYCNNYYARDLTEGASHPGLHYQNLIVEHWAQWNASLGN